MTSPRLAVTVGESRFYFNPNRHDAKPVYPSVTYAVGAIPKPGIPYWAARSVAEYAYDHSDEWLGLPRDDWWDEPTPEMEGWSKKRLKEALHHPGVVSTLKAVPWQYRDRAAARGSEVHAVVQKMTEGADYSVEAEVEPWIESARRYVEECRPEIFLNEITLFNEKHLYAGSTDCECRYRAFPRWGRCQVDYKTGKDVYPDMAVQLSAYANCDYWVNDADEEIPHEPPDTGVIVHLTPTGYEIYPVELTEDHRRAFLAALEIRRWEHRAAKLEAVPVPTFEELVEAEKAARVDKLRARIAGLSTHQALELTLQCRQEGIPTKPSAMTLAQIEQLDALITIYQDADAVIDELQIKQGRHRMWRRMV